jgi:hypothetical protein
MSTAMAIYLILGVLTSYLLERYMPELFQPRMVKRPFHTGQVVGVILLWWMVAMLVGTLWVIQRVLRRTDEPPPVAKAPKLEAVAKAHMQIVPTYDPIRHPHRDAQPMRMTGDHTGP